MTTELRKTQVDLDGLMRVLGQHLYSTPNVVVRELVQNAHDSCVRRVIEAGAAPDARIRVTADPEEGWIHVEDNGAGLTDTEIQEYLATVGRGRTRELREGGADGLIGLFGLGFLSAYVVAETTEVWTASHKEPDRAWRFTSRSGQSYTIEPAEGRDVGTRVSLHLKATSRELAEPFALVALLRRYCSLIPVPIEVTNDGTRIGGEPPPWRDAEASPLRRRKRSLEFAADYERSFSPLCTLEIEDPGDGPAGARVSGLLWIQDGTSYGSADNRNVSVFVRGMMVNDDARHLLPEWATFTGAVVESDALIPTASREDLQRDEVYDHARRCIAESLVSGLARLARDEPHTWRRVVLRHNEALLGSSLAAPRLFDLVADQLTVPTSMGDLPLATILRRSGGTVHVTQADRPGVESLLYRARDIPVVQGRRYGALAFARRYCQSRSGEVHVIGERADEELLGVRPGEPLDPRLEEWFGGPELQLVGAHFEPAALPFVALVDRSQELKARIESDQADAALGAATLALARSFTRKIEKAPPQRLYVNLECRAVQAVLRCDDPQRRGLGVRLLRSILGMLTAHDDLSGLPTLDESLVELGEVLTSVVAGGGGAEQRGDD